MIWYCYCSIFARDVLCATIFINYPPQCRSPCYNDVAIPFDIILSDQLQRRLHLHEQLNRRRRNCNILLLGWKIMWMQKHIVNSNYIIERALPCHLPKYYWPIDWGEIVLKILLNIIIKYYWNIIERAPVLPALPLAKILLANRLGGNSIGQYSARRYLPPPKSFTQGILSIRQIENLYFFSIWIQELAFFAWIFLLLKKCL